jgi:hypothetical protein
MADEIFRTVYVLQTQVPGGWQDHAETEDRASPPPATNPSPATAAPA